jgi:PAS domain S-box-containing protein
MFGGKLRMKQNHTSQHPNKKDVRKNQGDHNSIFHESQQSKELHEDVEDRYRKLWEIIFEGLCIHNNGIIIDANEMFAKTLGYKISEVIGKPVLKFAAPESHKLIMQNIKNGNDNTYEAIALRRDGSKFPVEIRGKTILFNDHQECVVALQDISERKQSIEALRESEERFRLVTEATRDAVYDWDIINDSSKRNSRYYELFAPTEKSSYSWWKSNIHPDDQKQISNNIQNVLSSKSDHWENEYRFKKTDDEYLHILDRGFIIRNNNGRAIRMIGAMMDITERKTFEEELKKYQEHLEELVEQRTQQLRDTNTELESFAYSVSHDLRAPLRAMQGFAKVLQEDYGPRLDSMGNEYANRIVEASKNMNEIIENLLSYSKLSREEIRLKRVSLDKIVKEVISEVGFKIKERNAEIEIESTLPTIYGHTFTLKKVISNLIMNSIIFVAPNTKPKVRIWSEKDRNWVRLYFQDNGIGIAADYHDKIFQIFERLHGIETYPGTGIGLAIVKRGIQRLYGKVGVYSEPGKGSTFWIELNLERLENAK